MIPILRHSLFALLVLLQLLAPLVHAHAAQAGMLPSSAQAGKIHVPGLEGLTAAFGRSQNNADAMAAATFDPSTEGLVVGVHAGIRQVLPLALADQTLFLALSISSQAAPRWRFAGRLTVSVFNIAVAPLSGNPCIPRAPPILPS